jgi:hypothetical protein
MTPTVLAERSFFVLRSSRFTGSLTGQMLAFSCAGLPHA